MTGAKKYDPNDPGNWRDGNACESAVEQLSSFDRAAVEKVMRILQRENALYRAEVLRLEAELADARGCFVIASQELDRYRAAAEKLLRLRGKL